MARPGHLARRFAASMSPHPPSAQDACWARSSLGEGEARLWDSMTAADRRHAVEVARRFVMRRPGASREEMAGALLHDVGKTVAGLGTFARVVATIVGPRTRRLRQYHDHESLGAGLAEAAGSDPVTVALITGSGPAAADLKAADDSI